MPPNPQAQAIKADMQKRFGDEAVMMGSEIPVGDPISTGSLALDYATDFGGFPSNRVVEIYGKEGTGKTTLALHAMLNALDLRPNHYGLFMDVEHKIDKDWLEMIVGPELLDTRLFYMQPETIEEATNMYRYALSKWPMCCAILDSIGGSPTVRDNEDAEVRTVTGNSSGVTVWARAACTQASIRDCLTIGINQVRSVINTRIPGLVDTPGGWAWRHHCTLRIELVRGREKEEATINGEKMRIGYDIHAKVRKNGVGPEGRTAMYWFYNIPTPEHPFGIDKLDEITRLAPLTKVVTRKGGWYHHDLLPGGKLQGFDAFKAAVKEDKEIQKALAVEVMATIATVGAHVAPMSDPEAEVSTDMLGMYHKDLFRDPT
jgi:recombination protein RecA